MLQTNSDKAPAHQASHSGVATPIRAENGSASNVIRAGVVDPRSSRGRVSDARMPPTAQEP